jgi:hypothetical protein
MQKTATKCVPHLLNEGQGESHASQGRIMPIREFLAKNNTTITPHTSYSLDSVPYDVPIFKKCKTVLKGRRLIPP